MNRYFHFLCFFDTFWAVYGHFSDSTSINDSLTTELNFLLDWITRVFWLNNSLNWILNRILNWVIFQQNSNIKLDRIGYRQPLKQLTRIRINHCPWERKVGERKKNNYSKRYCTLHCCLHAHTSSLFLASTEPEAWVKYFYLCILHNRNQENHPNLNFHILSSFWPHV